MMKQVVKNILAFWGSLFEPKAPKILFLGDSLFKMGNWNQLLQRYDILNRGVGGDSLSRILERAQKLGDTRARIIFLEGGINDFPQSDVEILFSQYQQLIAFWESKKVILVVNSLVFIAPEAAKTYPWRADWKTINQQVQSFNESLMAFCTAKNIDFIDLNSRLSNTDQLRNEYTTDGVHFSQSAYLIWAAEIARILEKHQI